MDDSTPPTGRSPQFPQRPDAPQVTVHRMKSPPNEFWHIATEPYGPEGEYGHWLTYSMVLIPAAWLAVVGLKDRRRTFAIAH